jgi:hypothetical protein
MKYPDLPQERAYMNGRHCVYYKEDMYSYGKACIEAYKAEQEQVKEDTKVQLAALFKEPNVNLDRRSTT